MLVKREMSILNVYKKSITSWDMAWHNSKFIDVFWTHSVLVNHSCTIRRSPWGDFSLPPDFE